VASGTGRGHAQASVAGVASSIELGNRPARPVAMPAGEFHRSRPNGVLRL
jgi:hypothetical protein